MTPLLRQFIGEHELRPGKFQYDFSGFRVVLPESLRLSVSEGMEGLQVQFTPTVHVQKDMPGKLLDVLLGPWTSANVRSVELREQGGVVVRDERGNELLRTGG